MTTTNAKNKNVVNALHDVAGAFREQHRPEERRRFILGSQMMALGNLAARFPRGAVRTLNTGISIFMGFEDHEGRWTLMLPLRPVEFFLIGLIIFASIVGFLFTRGAK